MLDLNHLFKFIDFNQNFYILVTKFIGFVKYSSFIKFLIKVFEQCI